MFLSVKQSCIKNRYIWLYLYIYYICMLWWTNMETLMFKWAAFEESVQFDCLYCKCRNVETLTQSTSTALTLDLIISNINLKTIIWLMAHLIRGDVKPWRDTCLSDSTKCKKITNQTLVFIMCLHPVFAISRNTTLFTGDLFWTVIQEVLHPLSVPLPTLI